MLRVAYISTNTPAEQPKRLTAKQRLHNEAIASLAARKHFDAAKAPKRLAPAIAELEQMKKKLLKTQ